MMSQEREYLKEFVRVNKKETKLSESLSRLTSESGLQSIRCIPNSHPGGTLGALLVY